MTAEKRPRWSARVAPAPLRNKAEHHAALDELMRLARLIDSGKASKSQIDSAHVLKLLVLDYEHARFGNPGEFTDTPIERLRYILDEHSMSASDLGRLLGDRPLGCRILSGQRELSKMQIRKLADFFKLEPGYFM